MNYFLFFFNIILHHHYWGCKRTETIMSKFGLSLDKLNSDTVSGGVMPTPVVSKLRNSSSR
jgi:hypothetical protein